MNITIKSVVIACMVIVLPLMVLTAEAGDPGWNVTLHCQGDSLGDNPRDYYATIGIGDAAVMEEAVTATPPEVTTVMYVFQPPFAAQKSVPFFKDIRAAGDNRYEWIIKVDPNGVYESDAVMTSTLSWSIPKNAGGAFALIEGTDASGQVVVKDMRRTDSYIVTGGVPVFFTVTFTP